MVGATDNRERAMSRRIRRMLMMVVTAAGAHAAVACDRQSNGGGDQAGDVSGHSTYLKQPDDTSSANETARDSGRDSAAPRVAP